MSILLLSLITCHCLTSDLAVEVNDMSLSGQLAVKAKVMSFYQSSCC